jgi:hypothetical protein
LCEQVNSESGLTKMSEPPGTAGTATRSVECLRKLLQDDLKETEGMCTSRKRWAFGLRLTAAGLGALTTIAIGVEGLTPFHDYRYHFLVTALVLSAFVAVINSWEAFFDYRWDWVRFKSTCATLRCLLYTLDYKASKGAISESEV